MKCYFIKRCTNGSARWIEEVKDINQDTKILTKTKFPVVMSPDGTVGTPLDSKWILVDGMVECDGFDIILTEDEIAIATRTDTGISGVIEMTFSKVIEFKQKYDKVFEKIKLSNDLDK